MPTCAICFDDVWDDLKRVYFRHPNPIVLDVKCNAIRSKYSPGTVFVGVHCRYGDYVNQQDTHPVPTDRYYSAALAHVPAGAVIVLYSDDMPQALKRKCWGTRRLLTINDSPTDTMGIVSSLCTYHIIANSSFSWWTAKLSDAPHKNIIMPSPWFGPEGPKKHTLYLPDCTVVNYLTGKEFVSDGSTVPTRQL